MGIGTFGSRTAVLCGGAIAVAADRVIEKGKRLAAHFLEAAETDLVFENGRFEVAGTDRGMDITEVARRSFARDQLPAGMEPGLNEHADYGTAPAWPNGTHICEVEVDAETGTVRLTRYVAVDDVGTVLNPMLVEGQVMGGIVQGAGQALMEDLVYDPDSGQLVTGSFTDYCMPRADDFCQFEMHESPVPTMTNPLGVKGCGESGPTAGMPAIVNAVVDALSEFGVTEIDMPVTPEKIWRAMRG
jgi:carbon-monoxide dehydrogenase large subunit